MIKKNDLYQVENFFPPTIKAIFTTRNGGVSQKPYNTLNIAYQVDDNHLDVLENRKILADKLEEKLENFVFMEQLHTTNFQEVKKSDRGRGKTDFHDGLRAKDAIYTYESNIVLTAFFADCTPIFICVPDYHLVGIIHAGWQGTVKGITDKFINHLIYNEKIPPQSIYAVIGPSICKNNFEVENDVITLVKQMPYQNVSQTYEKISAHKYHLDVAKLNKIQLLNYQIPEENIQMSNLCTYENADDFFSYRREKETGRMGGCIVQN